MKNLFTFLFVLTFLQFTYAQVGDGDKPPATKTQKTKTTTSTGIGISIDLTSIFNLLKKNKNCDQIEMVFPQNGSKFISNSTAPSLFRWKSSKPELVVSYIVQLVLLNKREKTILFERLLF
ncbi:MAG: hypothetical protein IIB06_01240 [Bacteroidetes bacterium]|nr:hypothetical protein [Bacteroidota bacterium]